MQKPLEKSQVSKTFTVPAHHDYDLKDIIIAEAFSGIKTKPLDRLEKKLRSLLFLAVACNFESVRINIKFAPNSEMLVLEGFEFRDETHVPLSLFSGIVSFFNRLLDSPNILQLIEQELLTPAILLQCLQTPKKQEQLFILDNKMAFEIFKARHMNFDQLWYLTPDQEENLKADTCYYCLVQAGHINLRDVTAFAPLKREFLNHPVVCALILNGSVNIYDWQHTDSTQLATLRANDPKTHDAFIKEITLRKSNLREHLGVIMRP